MSCPVVGLRDTGGVKNFNMGISDGALSTVSSSSLLDDPRMPLSLNLFEIYQVIIMILFHLTVKGSLTVWALYAYFSDS